MRKSALLALLVLAPLQAFAWNYKGIDKNVAMVCGPAIPRLNSYDQDWVLAEQKVVVLSDNFTQDAGALRRLYGRYGGDIGQMYTVEGEFKKNGEVASIVGNDGSAPKALEAHQLTGLVDRFGGWIDSTSRVYENDRYILDARRYRNSEAYNRMHMIDKQTGAKYICVVKSQPDCC